MTERAQSASCLLQSIVTASSYLQLGADSALLGAALRARPTAVTVVHEGSRLETLRALLQHGGGFAIFRCVSGPPLYTEVAGEHDLVLWCGGGSYVEAYRAVVRGSRLARRGVAVTQWTAHPVRQGAMDAARDVGLEFDLDERILEEGDDYDAWRGGVGVLWWRR